MESQLMNHDEALKSLAVERYLLKEMTETERNSFEEHYLACAECFEAVMFGSEFIQQAGDVLREREPARQPAAAAVAPAPLMATPRGFFKGLLRPSLAPAFAMLFLFAAGATVYESILIHKQSEMIADLKAPAIEMRYLLRGQSHAAVRTITVPRSSRIRLAAEFTPSDQFASYEARILDNAGAVVYSLPFSAESSQEIIEVSLIAGALKPGSYSMVVQGVSSDGARTPLGEKPFVLHFLD